MKRNITCILVMYQSELRKVIISFLKNSANCNNPSPKSKVQSLKSKVEGFLMFNLPQIFTVDLNNKDKLISVKVRHFDSN